MIKSPTGTKLIGEALIEQKLLTSEQLAEVISLHLKQKQQVGETAVSLGFISEAAFAKFLAQFLNLGYVELQSNEEIDPAAVELISEHLARRYHLITIQKEDEHVTVAMADPLDVRAIDAVRLETGCRVRKVVASRSAILKAIEHSYHTSIRLAQSMDRLVAGESVSSQGLQIQTFAETQTQLEQLKHEACADQYADMGTSDFLTGLMEQHEKMAWMLRSMKG